MHHGAEMPEKAVTGGAVSPTPLVHYSYLHVEADVGARRSGAAPRKSNVITKLLDLTSIYSASLRFHV